MGKDKEKTRSAETKQTLAITAPGLIDGGNMVVSKKSKEKTSDSD